MDDLDLDRWAKQRITIIFPTKPNWARSKEQVAGSPKTGFPTELKTFLHIGVVEEVALRDGRAKLSHQSSGPIMCSPAPPWGYFWAHLQWSWFRWKALAQCVAWKDSILMPEMMILAIILLVSFWCVTVVIKYICSLCHKLLNVPDQNGSAVWPKDQRCRNWFLEKKIRRHRRTFP